MTVKLWKVSKRSIFESVFVYFRADGWQNDLIDLSKKYQVSALAKALKKNPSTISRLIRNVKTRSCSSSDESDDASKDKGGKQSKGGKAKGGKQSKGSGNSKTNGKKRPLPVEKLFDIDVAHKNIEKLECCKKKCLAKKIDVIPNTMELPSGDMGLLIGEHGLCRFAMEAVCYLFRLTHRYIMLVMIHTNL